MEFKEINSIQDLESIGSLEQAIQQLNAQISPLFVKAESFEELFQILLTLKKNWVPFVEGPFVSKKAEYIYYLTQLDGKARNDALGIEDECYESLDAAKKWKRNIQKYVHPDMGGDEKAFKILTKIYDVLVESEDSSND